MEKMALHARNNAVSDPEDAAEDLIYHITHDLRAPLRALTILPDWIEEDFAEGGGTMPDIVVDHLDMIRDQTKALDKMILDLRDYSRVGRLADPPREVNFQAIISEIVQELEAADQLSLNLQLDVAAMRAPANDLKSLLKCLISNALQHHDRERANVLIRSRTTEDGLQLSVIDDGPGIPAEHRERAFELMATLYRRDEGAGSGVGLALARRVVSNLNGRIRIIDSPDGNGTHVEILFPSASIIADVVQNQKSRLLR
jgi:signal transduction histidine kinase